MSDGQAVIQVQLRAVGSPVVIGVPFVQGTLLVGQSVVVRQPNGAACMANTRPIVQWPDGSVRWLLVSFIADVSGAHTIDVSPHDLPESLVAPVACVVSDAGVVLDNDLLRLDLRKAGPGPIASLVAHGRAMIGSASDLRFCVDDANTSHEKQRTIKVLERGAARSRVRIEGAHFDEAGKRRLTYRLDVELWAGLSTLRLDYQFFHTEPGQRELSIKRIWMQADLTLSSYNAERHFLQKYHGEFYRPREVRNHAAVAIVADSQRIQPHVESPSMLLDDEQYAPYLDPPLVGTPDWLGVVEGDMAVYAHAQDFAEMQPSRLFSAGATIGFDCWPQRAGAMTLPQGRSRRSVITLTFNEQGAMSPAAVERAVKAPLWEGRECVDPQWLAHCGEFEQQFVLPYGEHGRFEGYMKRLVNLETPCDFIDLGDTPEPGYQRSYTTLGLQRQPRLKEAAQMPRVFNAVSRQMASWVDMTQYEQVWTNNEYDAIHAFATELMRTGRHELWDQLRWQARHNVEVDFWHFRDEYWLNRISPVHSAGHATSGGYPSHFWTQGLLEYYCLTGDHDVYEVAYALGEALLRFFHDPERGELYRAYDRELGWALLALTHLWDITREQRFEKEVERLIKFFIDYHTAHPDVPIHSIHYIERFYFMLNMVEAIDLYERRTGKKELGDWLVGVLAPMRQAIPAAMRKGYASNSTAPAMSIGYERTGDPSYLKASLASVDRLVTDDSRWIDTSNSVKPMAVRHREWVRYFGQAHRAGLLGQYEYPNLRGSD
jgi:hypothetical protein